MSPKPPVPAASTPPYPAHPAPVDKSSSGKEEAQPQPEEAKRHVVAKGAAIGIGSAAIVAALLYIRRK